jgi:hypothetical protein
MIRKALLCLSLLVFVLAVGCEGDTGGGNGGGGTGGVTVSIDTSNIHPALYKQDLLMVPVIVTPRAVPNSDISYWVELLSREGYSYGRLSVHWVEGEAPTAKEVVFWLGSDDASASHVYAQLIYDFRHNLLETLEADASALLKVEISKG